MKITLKKIFTILLTGCILSASLIGFNCLEPVNAQELTPKACDPLLKNEIEKGSEENYQFVEMISNNENINLSNENVFVSFFDDGTASVTVFYENGDIDVYSSLTGKQLHDIYESNPELKQQKGIIKEIYEALVELKRKAEPVGDVISFFCSVLRIIGSGNPCGDITDQIIQNLKEVHTARFEVQKFLHKDPACPYPPNSLQCSQPPYAYTKTHFTRVM